MVSAPLFFFDVNLEQISYICIERVYLFSLSILSVGVIPSLLHLSATDSSDELGGPHASIQVRLRDAAKQA